MLNATVTITGDAALIAKLEKMGPAISDFSGALKQIGEKLVPYYRDDAFNARGGEFGVPWPRLAPSTIAFKKKHFREYASVPLMATGTMRDSFTAENTEHELTIGNDAPYFVYHQSREERHIIPRRQMLGVSPKVKQIIKQAIDQDIRQKIGAL